MKNNLHVDSAKGALGESRTKFMSRSRRINAPVLPFLLSSLLLFSSSSFAQSGSISLTNSPAQIGRSNFTATLLENGKVLITGGAGANTQVEAFTFALGSFQVAGAMSAGRSNHTATLLPSGQILITGGNDSNGIPLATVELYDPTTGISTSTPTALQSPRSNHRATLLRDGRVLITGGLDPSGIPLATAEIYDPNTGLFTSTGTMQRGRSQHTATLLADNRVLITGGANYSAHLACSTLLGARCGPDPNTVWVDGESSAELYNPETGLFTVTGSMQTGRWDHTATLLSSGKVLILAGGQASELQAFGPFGTLLGLWLVSPSAELFDPSSGVFIAAGTLNSGRAGHTATLLDSGLVLVAGGESLFPGSSKIDSTELFDPTVGIASPGPHLSVARSHHTATTIPEGPVLIVGGADNTAELYWPDGTAITVGALRVASIPFSWGYTWNGFSGGPCNTNWYTTGIIFRNDFLLSEMRVPNYNNGYGGGFFIYEDAPINLYASSSNSSVNFGDGVAKFFFSSPLIRAGHTYYFDGVHVGPPGNDFFTGGLNNCGPSTWDFYSAPLLRLGTISVSTNNPAATFTVADGSGHLFTGSGSSLSRGVPPETYTITFGSIAGFITPAPTTAHVGSGQTLNFSGTYIAVLPPLKADLGLQGQDGKQQQNVAEPISTGTGNYYYQHTDLVVPGRAKPLVFERTYNTLDNYAGPLGANWTHNYNVALTPAQNGTVTIKWGDGHAEIFTANGSAYLPQPGVYSTLTMNADGSFALKKKDQSMFAFSNTGKLSAITDRNGNATKLTYDGTGNLVQVTDPGGRTLDLSFDSSSRIIQVTDPAGRVESFQYDSNNNLSQTTDPAGGTTEFAYDSSHRMISIVLPNGQSLMQNIYDSNGRAISQTNGLGHTWTFVYGTPTPSDTTITDARGNQTIHTYDSFLRIVQIRNAMNGTVSFTYDGNNNRASITNQSGKRAGFSYDGRGNLIAITDPNGNASAFTYDGRNNLLSATDAKGNATTCSYDGNGNLTNILDALGNSTGFTYDGVGQLTSKKDARGNITAYAYDRLGNLITVTDALGHSAALKYDGIGRLISFTDPNGHTASSTYDALSRLVKVADPLKHHTQFAYDAVGNLMKITDANGNTTSYAYDSVNNLVAVTDALGHVTKYSYDENNNRTVFTNAKGNATSYQYDTLNRLSTATDPLSFVTAYTYDVVGNVAAVKDANGNTNRFSYDALNHLVNVSYGDGKTVSYSYDANGNRTAMTDAHGKTGYAYDSLNRLTSVVIPDGKIIKYQYNAVGNRQSLTYPDGKVMMYAYDAVNRLSQAQDWLGRITNYSYDSAGNLSSLGYPNQAGISFTYDDANRLTVVSNSFIKANGKETGVSHHFGVFEYLLDAVGNRLQVSNRRGKIIRYSYDNLYELTGVTTERSGDDDDDQDDDGRVASYVYDAVGNRVQQTSRRKTVNYSYDAADRLLKAGAATYTYDANGNQTSVTRKASDYPIMFGYDAVNRLISVTGDAVSSSFSYDGDGNRVTQSVGSGTFNYVNDIASALPVVLQESGPDRDISYAFGLNLVSESGKGFDNFYQYDGLGSVVGLTDLEGRLIQRYVYDAWGQTLRSTVGRRIGSTSNFRFTGQDLAEETALYFFRARFYDPSLGRLLTHDPLSGLSQFPLSKNKYIYALSNPLRYADPSGLSASEAGMTVPTVSGLPFQLDLSNSGSTLLISPVLRGPSLCAKIDCISGFSFAATGADFAFHSNIGRALVVPGLIFTTAKTFADSQLDVGHKLGRLGAASALAALGLLPGPVGLVAGLAVGLIETFFPDQTNAAIDAGINVLGKGFNDILLWTLGDSLPVATVP